MTDSCWLDCCQSAGWLHPPNHRLLRSPQSAVLLSRWAFSGGIISLLIGWVGCSRPIGVYWLGQIAQTMTPDPSRAQMTTWYITFWSICTGEPCGSWLPTEPNSAVSSSNEHKAEQNQGTSVWNSHLDFQSLLPRYIRQTEQWTVSQQHFQLDRKMPVATERLFPRSGDQR